MDTQVVVVGAGPVGLMLAAELRLRGAAVTVLERLSEPTTESRASTLHARTMEIFDERGLVDRLGDPPRRPIGHFGGVPLDLATLPSRFAGLWSVPQARVEQVLGEWAVSLGVDIRRGHEVTGLTVEPDRALLRVTAPTGTMTVAAAYVAGCDGEASTVRHAAGITLTGSPATRELLRADVTGIRVADRRFERLPAGLAIAGRLPSGATRLMVGEHGSRAGRTGPVSFEELCDVWKRVTGEDISMGTPRWLNAFDDANLLADRYRDGRVLLAGDAAHIQMPSGGQAINLGLQDAVNLGWKLAAEVTGRAPEGLLDTYHAERHEVGRRALANIAAQSTLLLGTDVEPLRELLTILVAQPLVRDLLGGMISGLDVRYRGGNPASGGDRASNPASGRDGSGGPASGGDRAGNPASGRDGRAGTGLVGRRLPETVLSDDAGTVTTTTRQLRSGHGLLLDLTTDPAHQRRTRERAAGCAVPVDPAIAGSRPAAGSLDGLDTVVVRPDGHVAWVGCRGDDPGPALRRWFG